MPGQGARMSRGSWLGWREAGGRRAELVMLGSGQVGRRRHDGPRRGCRTWRVREMGQCAGPSGERLGGNQPLGPRSPDFREATSPSQGGWSVCSPKAPGWWQGLGSTQSLSD